MKTFDFFYLNFILDIIISSIAFPIFTIICSLFWIYKQLILFFAKIRRYDLIPVYGIDTGMSLETFAKPGIGECMDSKLNRNVGLLLRIPKNQSLSINWIRLKFETSFLKMDRNGKPLHLNFFSYFVQFGGYAFRQLVRSIDVEYHIQEVSVPAHQSLQTYLAELLTLSRSLRTQ